MAATLTHVGKELLLKMAFKRSAISTAAPSTLTLGLYNDATDAITAANDLADITTEPNTGNYARQTVTLDSADINLSANGGNWMIEYTEDGTDFTFDVTNTTGSVDSWFLVATFTSEQTSDVGDTAHLIGTGALSMTRDLGQNDTLNVDNVAQNL